MDLFRLYILFSHFRPRDATLEKSFFQMGCVMRKGPGRHDTWFRVICIWNHLLKMAAVIGFSFKERFLRFRLLFPDLYYFHHVIWGMKLAKKLKTKYGQNMSFRPFSHDAAHMSSYARAHVHMTYKETEGKFPWENHMTWNGKTKRTS